ncbi:SDR family oxidoreductase [bacterium]|jgi:NAD(P)-dependent dehydrogenase (short-subunit alcohol dehydrogenase family)|nr:SDR family oxidoreductase [bacterium]
MLNFETNFKNQVVLITGAASGIGQSTARAFAEKGATVVVADVLEASGVQTATEIEKNGGKAIFVKCDVSDERDIRNVMNRTLERFGRLDCAINNAGIEGEQASTVDCSVENWDRVINTNLRGLWLCMKYEIPQMLKQGKGSIVNISSIAGVVGFQGIPAYVASKHAVLGLTKTAALEYAKTGIRINAICPGVIQTPMIDRFVHGEAQIRKQLSDGEPVGRVGRPEEVASAILWLCSEGASFVTGHPLVVDGGWVAQ